MKTRVLLVDDSPLVRAMLRETFERTSDMEVVGESGDGQEAVEFACKLRPDIITMDVVMPKMDGLAATEAIMRLCPTPIVIVARDSGGIPNLAVEALGRGALEVFPKPESGFDGRLANELSVVVRRVVREARNRASTSFSQAPATRGGPNKIRVLIVDDSAIVRQFLRSALTQQPDMEVVGESRDGMDAVRLAEELRPDVVTLDMLMPMMGGQEAARRIMQRCPTGILVVANDAGDAQQMTKEATAAGAVEVLLKPSSGFDDGIRSKLTAAVRRVALARQKLAQTLPPAPRRATTVDPGDVAIVGITGSTGAPRVLFDLLRALPTDFAVPIVVVQHTERGFLSALANWLSTATRLPVCLGCEGQVLEPGTVVLAPDDLHMAVATRGIVHLEEGVPVAGFRPSGTVLFQSLATSFGRQALGLVLSGMGNDGAEGLGSIYAAGGTAIVEDPETATVAGMPERALAQAVGAFVERASRLAWLLIELVGSGQYRKR